MNIREKDKNSFDSINTSPPLSPKERKKTNADINSIFTSVIEKIKKGQGGALPPALIEPSKSRIETFIFKIRENH